MNVSEFVQQQRKQGFDRFLVSGFDKRHCISTVDYEDCYGLNDIDPFSKPILVNGTWKIFVPYL